MREEKELRIKEMKKLREKEGLTYAEIGKKFGISKQRVFFLIGGDTPRRIFITEKECIYKGLRDWMNENQVSRIKLTRAIYGYYQPNQYAVINHALLGSDCQKHVIDGILKATGLTYEKAFGMEINQSTIKG